MQSWAILLCYFKCVVNSIHILELTMLLQTLRLIIFFIFVRINLEGHRPRVRHYAHGLKKLIRIGQGEVSLCHSICYFFYLLVLLW